MKSIDIKNNRNHFITLLKSGRVHDAFSLLKGFTEASMQWELTEKLKNLEENYRYMLSYAVDGYEDNNRGKFVNSTLLSLREIYDLLIFRLKIAENSYELYINTSRLVNQSTDNLSDLIGNYLSDVQKKDNIYKRELEKNIFNTVWAKYSLTKEDKHSLENIWKAEEPTDTLSSLIIAGLFLRALSLGPSAEIFNILLDGYQLSALDSIKVKALTALVLLSLHYDPELPDNYIESILRDRGLFKDNQAKQIIQAVLIEYLRTKETELINKKMREDIIPDMMKMAPRMRERFRHIDPDELFDLEENPEWKDIISDNNIRNHIEEINRMQMQGSDVMMSTFGNLKNFPFFNDIYNWFLPFSTENDDVKRIGKALESQLEFLESSNIICDSDLYSLVFSLEQLPGDKRKLMLSSMGEQFGALKEMTENVRKEQSVELLVNRYMKNLYRFFNLFRRKDEFANPFSNIVNPVTDSSLRHFYNNGAFLERLGQFFYKLGMWEHGIDVFLFIEKSGYDIDKQLYQRIGYGFQRTGEFDKALNYFMHAELLDDNDSWTLKKIAFSSMKAGKWSTALDYFRKLEQTEQDNVKTVMAVGKCLMELGQYDEASKQYYKAHYLDAESKKIKRMLSRALILSKKYDDASRYIGKLVGDRPGSEDFLLQGFIEFIAGKYKESVDSFVKAYSLQKPSRDNFMDNLLMDEILIKETTGKINDFKLVLEQLNYKLDCL